MIDGWLILGEDDLTTSDATMATNGIDAPAAGQKPSFTVTQAAKAFRQARNGATKVELVDGEKRYVRRDHSGRFVLVAKKKSDSRVLTGSSRKR